ncbi:MAG: beta-eliminating lyase-related protein, partial [Desulfatiglandales bacterium]
METDMKKGFASDNNSGVHPEVLKALADVNAGHTVAYGEDVYTEAAKRAFREVFGEEVEAHFVFTGTGANVLSLQALTES